MPKVLARSNPGTTQSFGRWVEGQYVRRGWSQREFARRIGVAHPTVSRWINARINPERPVCYRIAEVLGYDVDDILQRAGHIVDAPRSVDGGVQLVPLTALDYEMIEQMRATGRRLRAEAAMLEARADQAEAAMRHADRVPSHENSDVLTP